jgi:hypothetical protein
MRLAALALLVLLPVAASGQVYRWEDERGTLFYSNAPDRVPEAIRPELGSPAAEPAAAATPDDATLFVASSPARSITRIPYTPGDAILVSATISGAGPVTLILDTGADRTMITPQALAKLGISLANAPRAEIAGVTGTSQGEVVQVDSMEVGDARVGPLRIVAHDAALQKADGLLGRDFLEQFTVTIDAREQIVTLTPH